MQDTNLKTGKAVIRDSEGRFLNGNGEGRKCQKGAAGKPKDAKNKIYLLLNHRLGKPEQRVQLKMPTRIVLIGKTVEKP